MTMKKSVLTYVTVLLTIHTSTAQFSKVFSDTYSNLNSWNSNNSLEWEIVENSNVAGGAIGSETLKLAATEDNSVNYLSIQNTDDWGTEQTWSFWLGRDNYAATISNASYVWLYADRADFTDEFIKGYRIRLGGNTVDGDDIILESVDGASTEVLIDKNNVIPSNFNNYGLTVFITRTSLGEWTIYTSESPTENGGGVNANANPLSTTIVNRNENGSSVIDLSFTDFRGGYFGFMAAQSSASNPEAKKAAEFDQFNFIPSVTRAVYTWTGRENSNYSDAKNWEPNRVVKRITDQVLFTSNATVTGITNDMISCIKFTGSVSVIFSAASDAEISITSGVAVGFYIEDGSTLNLTGSYPIKISLQENVTGKIDGTLYLSKETPGANVPHQISTMEHEGLLVYGSVIQECNGNVFGSGSKGEEKGVAFKNGAEFIFKSGANPFGESSDEKVVFEKGSWYRHQSSISFAFSGRNYSNFELNLPSPSAKVTITLPNNNPMTVDDFLINQGGLVVAHSSGSFSVNIQGNLTVSSNGRLEINKLSEGTSIFNLIGAEVPEQEINVIGEVEIGPSGILKIIGNYVLRNDLTIKGLGTFSLYSGRLNLNTFRLSFTDAFTIQKVFGEISSSIEDNPELAYVYGDGATTGVVTTGVELQSIASSLTVDNAEGLILFKSLTLRNTLILDLGKLYSSESIFITLEESAVVEKASNLSFVAGPIAKKLNSTSDFSFPVGQDNELREIVIIPSSADPATFKASYNNTPPPLHNVEGAMQDPLKSISEVEYWELERTNGNTSAKVKLFWNSKSGITVNDPESFDLRVARFEENIWVDKGASSYSMVTQNEGHLVSEFLTDNENLITFGSDSENTSFPVTFISFAGNQIGNKVLLSWVTTAEIDNKGFEIEKSTDGEEFVGIGFVAASESDELRKKYSYEDNEAFASSSYRLKQIDYNGSYKYSRVIYVSVEENNVLPFFKPNPFQGRVELEMVEDHQQLQGELRSVKGDLLGDFKGNVREINESLNIRLNSLTQGVYYFIISTLNSRRTIKLLKE